MCARLSTSVGKRENAWLGLVEVVSRCASLGFIGGSCTKASVGEVCAQRCRPCNLGRQVWHETVDVIPGPRVAALSRYLGWHRCPEISGNGYDVRWSVPSQDLGCGYTSGCRGVREELTWPG
ncbi:hypothetical protein B296_00029277 [Ensete ventricosum]|uniref:Uncharacterized protein n=1 Tax=Ensete ventricosum TaxID=4639 RepID=A0A426ZIF7_ENSVE|nr:hypothetical protein B296_00029277 [Ensete ventricosum]